MGAALDGRDGWSLTQLVRSRRALTLSLRWYLVALAAAVMLPLLVLATVEARDAILARESEVQLEMRLLLAGGVNGVEQGLDAMTATVRLLATSPSLAAHDLVAFRQEADELATARHVDLVLRDPSGAQIVATRVPRGAPLPSLPPEDRQAGPDLAANRAYVSDVYMSGMTHPFLTRVIVPVTMDSGATPQPRYQLEIAFTASVVSGWVASPGLPPHWFISVLGRNGTVVARQPNLDDYVGRGTGSDVFGPPDGFSGPWQGFDLDGKPLSGVYTRLDNGWTVLVGAPDALLAIPTRTALLVLAAAAVPLILGGLVCSVLLARRINDSVSRLERTARALGEGRVVSPEALPVRDLAFVQDALCTAGQDIAARRLTEQALLGEVRDGRDLLQAVVDGSSDLIFARDRENRLVLANQSSALLFGFRSSAEAVGQRLDSSPAPGAAALDCAQPAWIASVDNRLFEVSHSALRNMDGETIGTISIARDVTERVAADSRLHRLQSDLARAGRLSAVAAMGAGLAHELHQPLSAAANFLAVAMRRLGSGGGQFRRRRHGLQRDGGGVGSGVAHGRDRQAPARLHRRGGDAARHPGAAGARSGGRSVAARGRYRRQAALPDGRGDRGAGGHGQHPAGRVQPGAQRVRGRGRRRRGLGDAGARLRRVGDGQRAR